MTIIAFIRTLDYEACSLEELRAAISMEGYLNPSGNDFSIPEVQDLISPLIETNVVYDKEGFGSCGINRDKNPCGDASDY